MLTSAALASVVALLSPLVISRLRLPFPDVVVQVLLGVVLGHQVLGLAQVDEPLRILSLVGLSFLLFLAGLELEVSRLRGPALPLAFAGFAISFVLALGVGQVLFLADLVDSPLLIGVILSATALGIVLPVIKDAGQLDRPLGRVVVASASVAEVVPIVLLSLLFSEKAVDFGTQIVLVGAFVGLVLAAGVATLGLEHSRWLVRKLLALQNTTAEIRVRAAVALLMGFAAVAAALGLEAILGAFLAGATISLLDRDERRTHTLFRIKPQAVGFGAVIPFFFVATGISLDVRSLVDPATLVRIPIFLGALVLVRFVPAVLYRRLLGSWRLTVAAGLFQGTTLSIPIIGGTIGVDLGVIRPENFVALVAAGVISVVVFPTVASLLAKERTASPTVSRSGPVAGSPA